MKKLEQLIILISVIVVILGMTIVLHVVRERRKADISLTDPNNGAQGLAKDEKEEKKFKLESARNRYFAVERCINKYNDNIKELYPDDNIYYTEIDDEFKIENAKSLYHMLSEESIKDLEITKENIYTKVKGGEMHISALYVKELENNISEYIVFGKLKAYADNKLYDYGYIINVDFNNMSFEIYPYEYMVKNNYTSIEKLEDFKETTESIKKYSDNTISLKNVSDEEMIEKYFSIFKYMLMNDKQELYSVLDEEYRDNRFNNENEFLSYVTDNYNRLISSVLTNYNIEQKGDIKYYIIQDQYGNYYIFEETDLMQYKILLDNHTIDLPQFTEKYNSTRNENKAAMNIEKFKDAINTQDYKYAYEKLATSFKEKNYPTQSSFEEFVKNKLFYRNNFTYTDIEEKNGLYIFKVVVGDLTAKAKEDVTLNVVMQLNEGTDFTMSFSLE